MELTDVTYTISQANKSVRTAFFTLEDAHKYITKNKLFPNDDYEEILITETAITQHKVKIKKPELSEPFKTIMIESFLKALENPNILCCDYHMASSLYGYYRWNNDKTIEVDLAIEIVKNKYNTSDEDLQEAFGCNIRMSNEQKELERLLFDATTIDLILELVKKVLEKRESLKFVYTKTNYKACNAVCIVCDNLILQIRADDIVISSGYVYGRNVSLNTVANLDDDTLKKFDSRLLNIK